jgi:hypothetical protein
MLTGYRREAHLSFVANASAPDQDEGHRDRGITSEDAPADEREVGLAPAPGDELAVENGPAGCPRSSGCTGRHVPAPPAPYG